jgi:hypothetical protein
MNNFDTDFINLHKFSSGKIPSTRENGSNFPYPALLAGPEPLCESENNAACLWPCQKAYGAKRAVFLVREWTFFANLLNLLVILA